LKQNGSTRHPAFPTPSGNLCSTSEHNHCPPPQRFVWQCTFSTTPERFKIRPFGAVRLTNWIAAGFARHPVCMSAADHPHCVKQSCSKASVLHMLKKCYLEVLTLLTAILSGKPVRHRKMHIKPLVCFHLNLPWKQARLEEQDTELT